MKLIKVGNKIVNVGLVAWAEKQGIGVTLHFAVPVARGVAGMSYPQTATPPVASDHYSETFSGNDATTLWNELEGISLKG